MFTAITEKKNDVSGIKKPCNNKGKKMFHIEYFMESARVRCLHMSCGVSEIEQVSEANEWGFWYKTTGL